MGKNMMKLPWVKCPSVTGGGKPFFYTIKTDKGRFWISWDRMQNCWKLESESIWDTEKRRYISEISISLTSIQQGDDKLNELLLVP